MKSGNFFAELKRRNVYKVAVAYAVVGWLLVQVTTQVFPIFEIPNWALRLIVLAIIIGFPVALVIAWAFELTPEGLSSKAQAMTKATGNPMMIASTINRRAQFGISKIGKTWVVTWTNSQPTTAYATATL